MPAGDARRATRHLGDGALPAGGRRVALALGAEVRPAGRALSPVVGQASWSPLLARARGVPEVVLDPSAGTIADLATATAGFRQHHYALVPHLVEDRPEVLAAAGGEDLDVVPQEREGAGRPGVPAAAGREDLDVVSQERGSGGLVRVVTTGMVDPLSVGWGERSARIGGTRWERPAVDLDAVAVDDAVVARWFRARMRPKVLVAPQTRVVEAAVDGEGVLLPATPLVSVEPRPDAGDAAEVAWLLAVALSSPPITAWAVDRSAGTARGRGALKLSARQVLEVPLPIDVDRWRAVTAELRGGRALAASGSDLTAMYGLGRHDPVVAWWRARLPGSTPSR